MTTNIDLKSQANDGTDSDENESTAIEFEPINEPPEQDGQLAHSIKSEAFLNSVFHPNFKMKSIEEKEEAKVRAEYDKLVEKLSKGKHSIIFI